MLTIDESANKKILKAKRIINDAIEILIETRAYNDPRDIFHASTVHDVNRLITAVQTMND